MPHEHEMPAPVTTNIFLHFATESDKLESRWRVVVSEAAALRSRVVMGIAECPRWGVGGGGSRRGRGHRSAVAAASKRSDVDLHRVASRLHVITTRGCP